MRRIGPTIGGKPGLAQAVAPGKGMMEKNEDKEAGRTWQVVVQGGPVPADPAPPAGVVQEVASAGLPSAQARPPQQTSARSRKVEIVEFRRALFSGTPRVVMTPVLVLACVVVYGLMVASGVPILWPNGTQLIRWGASEGARIILRHEYWRLAAMVFVHGGLIHLAINMWSLFVIGPLVERLYGSLAFAVIYVAAGIGGAIASVGSAPMRVSVGASGAICGVLGALLAFLLMHRRAVPASVRKPFLANILAIIVFMAILGAFVPNIDHQAHLGGLATGFVCGLLLTRPWPVVRNRSAGIRRLTATVAIAAMLCGATMGLTRFGVRAVSPAARFNDLAIQLGPVLDEYNAIVAVTPSTMAMRRDHGDEPRRRKNSEVVAELIARAQANLGKLRTVSSPDSSLKSLIDTVVRAQTAHREALEAARSYLETGDRAFLDGEGGVLDHRSAAGAEIRAFQEQQQRYLNTNHVPGRRSAQAP